MSRVTLRLEYLNVFPRVLCCLGGLAVAQLAGQSFGLGLGTLIGLGVFAVNLYCQLFVHLGRLFLALASYLL